MFSHYSTLDILWLTVGLVGQGLFASRFLVQWLTSEYKRKSVIPDAFWYFSIFGGLVLLAYAIHKRDPVFILGQATGIIIYARNLYFIYLHKKQRSTEAIS